jgi:Zn-dependent membrane protease YugP
MLWLHRLFETPPWVYAALALAVGMALAARRRVDRACEPAAAIASRRGLTGAEAAAEMLRAAGVEGVVVEPGRGPMGTGYDSVARAIRLPRAVHDGRTLADVALAAHIVGHAMQHAGGDAPQPLAVRESIAAGVRLAAGTAVLLLGVGFVLDLPGSVALGALLLAAAALAPRLARPIERDAARRAARVLAMAALVDSAEARLVEPIVAAAGGLDTAAILPRLRPPAWRRRETPRHRPRAVPGR